MIRELADHDPTRFRAVLQIRVRDALGAFVARVRERALAEYRHAQALYVQGGLKKKPQWPAHLGEP